MRNRSFFLLTSFGALGCGSDPAPAPTPPAQTPYAFTKAIRENPSCILQCDQTCSETPEKPWVCPALAPWETIPHDPACGAFDGKTYPAVVPGKCVASEPSGDALVKANATGTPMVLPDGRRLQPEGKEWVFNEDGFGGGFPASILLIPGTRFLLVNDNGYKDHSLRVIDTAILKAGGPTPIASVIKYPAPAALNYGMAYVAATKLLYAGGGSNDSMIRAYDFDETTGKITFNAAKSIALPKGMLPQGLSISPDGKKLLFGQALDLDGDSKNRVMMYSIDAANYGTLLTKIDARQKDAFAVRFDPDDPTGNAAYVTMWTGLAANSIDNMRLLQLDLAGSAAKAIIVGKAPEEIAFLDARYMAVANSLSDTLSIIDRPAGVIVGDVAIGGKSWGPSALAFDRTRNRLYATLSGVNGVAVFDVTLSASAAPSVVPAGVIATAWWPTGVVVDPADGSLLISNGKGHGSGNNQSATALVTDGTVAQQIRGSIQAVPFMLAGDLAQATARYESANIVSDRVGYPKVECGGAPNDFPIPSKIEDGPSTKIKHVFFVVRENKTFDGVMGEQPGVDGDPKLVLAPGHMDEIWGNAHKLAGEFAQMDNYYIDAEQSIQGHAWTVFGRSTDYTERRWLVTWGREEFSALGFAPGVGDETTPVEGTIFSSLANAGVGVEKMGELIGGPLNYKDLDWPGSSTSSSVPDTLGACYMSARLRAQCNPKDFSYLWINNDHTFGLAAGSPNPAQMIATNDIGTGMLLDGLSHSPFWQDSLFIVIEDDPNGGDDHVDLHRTIALFASPWIKRKYVSHAHYDVASLHKLISHVFGKPYRNSTIANAPLPLDLFTSTPDYTPYDHKPPSYADRSCNPGGTKEASVAAEWDFKDPDEQPGLSEQVSEALKHLPASQKPAPQK